MSFEDNSIIISNNKDILISDKLLNIKIMNIDELYSNFYFYYDEKTIYYLMDKYGFDYDVCLKYLKNMYFIFDNDFGNKKIKEIVNLKEELLSSDYLYVNKLFKDSLNNKKIIFYNCDLNKSHDILINDLSKYTSVSIINDSIDDLYSHVINEFDSIDDEVSYISSSIVKLINNGININNIKLCGVTAEYKNVIKRIFKFYNIPIIFNDNYLFSTSIAKDFLKYFSLDFDSVLKYISSKYDMNDIGVKEIYNSIIKIINKYVWASDEDIIKKMICYEFKNTIINSVNLTNSIEVIDNIGTYKDNYIFLLNFSQGNVPAIYKDDDFLSDNLKELLHLDTSSSLNSRLYNKWLNDIKSCKNLFISYKKHSFLGEFYLSSLNDDLLYDIDRPSLEYNYSHIYNKLILSSYLDNYIKYNIYNDDISLLYNNYSNINYMNYNNKFTSIDNNKLLSFLNNNLILSYSALNNYYHCSFKYYLSNILKLNIYNESFYTIIGNVFHHILSLCFDKDIDISSEYYNYLSKLDYKFDDREKFFLDNLFFELIFVINTIKKQYLYSSLNKSSYEEEVIVDKSIKDMKIIFKGFIDKILFDDSYNYASIIDYKTGSVDVDLNNCVYGLDMQLPVYVYLLKNKYPNIKIVGFYLQKIINNDILINDDKDYNIMKEDKLKLQGYTNSNEDIIKLLDFNYQDSKVIKGMKLSSKGISSKKIFDDEITSKLCNIVDSKIDEATDNILIANFPINPKNNGDSNIGCMYCKYKDICFVREEDIIYLDPIKDSLL